MALQWVTFINKDEIKDGQREVFDTDYGSIRVELPPDFLRNQHFRIPRAHSRHYPGF